MKLTDVKKKVIICYFDSENTFILFKIGLATGYLFTSDIDRE